MISRRMFISHLLFCSMLLSSAVAYAAGKAHVLVISVDGMRPDYITQADKHGLKIPNMRKLYAQSTYADGVIGVVPTITYPSHTTMMTGVWPIQHGIYGNQKFSPFAEGKEQITDISDIKVETLWEAAHKAGYTVSSVGWPVTTGAKFIDWLLPANAAFEGSDPDGASKAAQAGIHYDNPPGLREQLVPFMPKGKKLTVSEQRHEWQVEVIKRFKPEFITVHIGNLDHQEHAHGPFSPQANQAMEDADHIIGRLVTAERANYPDAYIFVVSDHGFLPTDHALSMNAIFIQEGLLDLQHKTWKAAAYTTGATSAILVHDPNDAATLAKVKAIVEAAAKNPAYGIGRVYSHDEVVAMGGIPDAVFMLDPMPGWRFAMGSRQIVTEVPGTGAHGQMPSHPELRASFFLIGPGVPHHDLGVIDMRQIAPTIAKILKVKLPEAKLAPVKYTR